MGLSSATGSPMFKYVHINNNEKCIYYDIEKCNVRDSLGVCKAL